ncbi:unnamed protein product [Paramecium sonneborni]|uniref:Uncharacterized protein n=1 Tax=Paramecium sonneborni TaxID=65129 RepID=A0A8S1M354_9CILI|nr:unnamed protein product [Paramecium sonneborni]
MAGVLKTVGDYFELDKYQNEIAPFVKENYNMVQQMIQTKEKECLNKNLDNEQKYIECMQKNAERSERALKRLEYGIMYWKQKTYECFHSEAYKDKEIKNFDRCKPIANNELQEIFSSFRL